MAVTKLISSGVSDQILHKFDITDKGVDTLMDNLGTPNFESNFNEVFNSIQETINRTTNITTPDFSGFVSAPLAGNKCPAY